MCTVKTRRVSIKIKKQKPTLLNEQYVWNSFNVYEIHMHYLTNLLLFPSIFVNFLSWNISEYFFTVLLTLTFKTNCPCFEESKSREYLDVGFLLLICTHYSPEKSAKAIPNLPSNNNRNEVKGKSEDDMRA